MAIEDLRQSPMMSHLMAALDRHQDGRLAIARTVPELLECRVHAVVLRRIGAERTPTERLEDGLEVRHRKNHARSNVELPVVLINKHA